MVGCTPLSGSGPLLDTWPRHELCMIWQPELEAPPSIQRAIPQKAKHLPENFLHLLFKLAFEASGKDPTSAGCPIVWALSG